MVRRDERGIKLAVGHKVKRLHRLQVGFINVKGLRPGEYRRMKPQEVKDLRALALEKKERGFRR